MLEYRISYQGERAMGVGRERKGIEMGKDRPGKRGR